MRVIFKGIVTHVGEIDTAKHSPVQRIEVEKKIFDMITGEVQRSDTFPVAFFGELIQKTNLPSLMDKKVEVTAYLNSFRVEKEGLSFNNLYLTGREIKLIP